MYFIKNLVTINLLIGLSNKNYFIQNKTIAIIFWDFDGTLAYSNHLWSTTVYNSLKEAAPNSKIEFPQIRKCMANGFTWHTPNKNHRDLIGNQWREYMNNIIALDYISLGIDEKTASKAAQLVRKNIKNINGENL